MDFFIWAVIAFFSIITEFFTKMRVALSLFLASGIALISSFATEKLWIEIAAFILSAIIFLCVRFFLLRPKKMTADYGIDAEHIVGSRCRVVEKIENVAGSGQARLHGADWAARALDDDEIFAVGETVTVVAVEGVRLVCKK